MVRSERAGAVFTVRLPEYLTARLDAEVRRRSAAAGVELGRPTVLVAVLRQLWGGAKVAAPKADPPASTRKRAKRPARKAAGRPGKATKAGKKPRGTRPADEALRKALAAAQGHVPTAAKALGVTPAALYRWLQHDPSLKG
jgi:hypothetical protein